MSSKRQTVTPSDVWLKPTLFPADRSLILELVAPYLGPNERACLRLVDAGASKRLKQHNTLHLSQPILPSAFAEHWSRPGACRHLTRAQREQLVCCVAASNVLPNLELALAAADLAPSVKHLEAAAQAGATESVGWLMPQLPGEKDGSRKDRWEVTLLSAAKAGKWELCQWCFASCPGLFGGSAHEALVEAALNGQAELALWLIEEGERLENAVPSEPEDLAPGQVETEVEAVAAPGETAAASAEGAVAAEAEATTEDQEAVETLAEPPAEATAVEVEVAARDAEAEMALAEPAVEAPAATAGAEPGAEAEAEAEVEAEAAPGNEDEGEASEGEGEPWSDDPDGHYDPALRRAQAVCEAAMLGCDLPTARRLVARYNEAYGTTAGLEGQLRAALASRTPDWRAKLDWLRTETGDEIGRSRWFLVPLMDQLAGALIPERFEWLRAQGVRPGSAALLLAVDRHCAEALEWLLQETGGVWPESVERRGLPFAIEEAARHGDLRLVKVLCKAVGRCRASLLEDVFQEAARGGHVAVLEWLWSKFTDPRARRRMRRSDALDEAARSGSVEAMRWLAARGCRATDDAWAAAVKSGCESAVEVLTELRCPMPSGDDEEASAAYQSALEHSEWRMPALLDRLGLPLGDATVLGQAAEGHAPLHVLKSLAGALARERVQPDWEAVGRAVRDSRRSAEEVAKAVRWIEGQRAAEGKR